MKKIIFLILIFAVPIFAANKIDNSDVIWVWGDGALLAKMISVLYAILSEKDFVKYVSIAIITAGMYVASMKAIKQSLSGGGAIGTLFYCGLLVWGVWTVFIQIPRNDITRVFILNMNQGANGTWAKCTPVNGDSNCYLPFGIKLVLTSMTNIERAVMAIIEKAAIKTDALAYSYKNAGLGYTFEMYKQADNIIPSLYARKTFNTFWDSCLIYEMTSNHKNVDDIMKSQNLTKDILTPNSARVTVVYNKKYPQGKTTLCSDVTLNDLVDTIDCPAIVESLPQGDKRDVNKVCKGYGHFAQTMLSTVQSADESIKQSIMIRMSKNAMRSSMILAGLDPNVMASGATTADREQRTKWASMGLMAQEYLPVIRDVLFSFGVLASVFLSFCAIFGLVKPLMAIVSYFATLMVWSVSLEFVNIATYHYISSSISHMFNFDLGRLGSRDVILTHNYIVDYTQKALALMGYMAIATFAISRAIVSMSGSQLTAAYNGMTSGLGLSAFSVRNAAQGKIETPLSSIDSERVRAYNAAEKMNLALSYTGKQMEKRIDDNGFEQEKTIVNGNYATKVTNPAGNSFVMNEFGKISRVDNNVGQTASKTESLNDIVSHQHVQASKETKTRAKAYMEAMSNTLSELDSAGFTHGTAFGKTYNKNADGSWSVADEKGKTENYVHNNEGGTAWSITGKAGASLNASAGLKVLGNGAQVKVGVGVDGAYSYNSKDTDSHSDGANKNKKTSESYKEGSKIGKTFTEGSDTKLTQNLANNLSKVASESKAYTEAKSKDENFQKLEQISKSNVASIAENLDTSILQEVSDRTDGNISAAEQTFKDLQDPEKRKELYNQQLEKMSANAKEFSNFVEQGSKNINKDVNRNGIATVDDFKIQGKNKVGETYTQWLNKIDPQVKDEVVNMVEQMRGKSIMTDNEIQGYVDEMFKKDVGTIEQLKEFSKNNNLADIAKNTILDKQTLNKFPVKK